MENLIKPTFLLPLIGSIALVSGCSSTQVPPPAKPKTQATSVVLGLLRASPKGKIRDYNTDDSVSVIDNEGVFHVDGMVKEQLAEKGYQIQIGTGRTATYDWYQPFQIFPAPWANALKLKVGDTVYQNRLGDYEWQKGRIVSVPVGRYGSFDVKFDRYSESSDVQIKEIFTSIKTPKLQDVAPGDIIFYDKQVWAIVIGQRNGKVLIRKDDDSGHEDAGAEAFVEVSKIQVVK